MGNFVLVLVLLLGIFVVHSNESDDFISLEEFDFDDELTVEKLTTHTTTTTSKSTKLDTAPKPSSSSSSSMPQSSSNKLPLIERYINRKIQISDDLVRDLKRSKFEVALNVYSTVKPQIDDALFHIFQLLGENCTSLWRPTPTRSRFPCTTSQEQVQQKMSELDDTILINTNYRKNSIATINKFQTEITKLNQNYATAIRSATNNSNQIFPSLTSNKIDQNEAQQIKEKDNVVVVDDDETAPLLSHTPLASLPFNESKTKDNSNEYQFDEPGGEEKEDRFHVIESLMEDKEQINHFTQFIDELKAAGPEKSSQLVQLAVKIKNSRSRNSIVPELKAKFPRVVQNIVWGSKSKIKIQVGNDTFQIISDKNQTIRGLNDEPENLVMDGPPLSPLPISEGHEWKFLPHDNASYFALFNIDFRLLLAYELTKNKDNPDHNGTTKSIKKEGRVVLLPIEEKDLNMFPSNFLWKIVLLCQRTLMTVQDYSETFVQHLNGTSGDHGHPDADDNNNNNTTQQCPDDSLLVSLVSLDFPDLSLDVDVNGKLFLSEAHNPGKFDVY